MQEVAGGRWIGIQKHVAGMAEEPRRVLLANKLHLSQCTCEGWTYFDSQMKLMPGGSYLTLGCIHLDVIYVLTSTEVIKPRVEKSIYHVPTQEFTAGVGEVPAAGTPCHYIREDGSVNRKLTGEYRGQCDVHGVMRYTLLVADLNINVYAERICLAKG